MSGPDPAIPLMTRCVIANMTQCVIIVKCDSKKISRVMRGWVDFPIDIPWGLNYGFKRYDNVLPSRISGCTHRRSRSILMTQPDVSDAQFTRLKRTLQQFQSDRLSRTYADLMANPEYQKMARFFFGKLYAPDDFAFRDQSIKTLHRVLKGAVYSGMVSAVGLVIELHEFSDRLDDRMVEEMIRQEVGEDMDLAQYAEIYRALDNEDERVYQIELIGRVTRAFHKLSHKWMVGVSLKTVRATARILGMGRIMDFVGEGYDAFKTIKDIDPLIETILQREFAWHDALLRGDPELLLE